MRTNRGALCGMLAGILVGGTFAPAATTNRTVRLTHDWPRYTGPIETFTDPSKVAILADLSQSKLVWVNEQDDLGYAKATSGGGHCYPKHMKPSGCGSLILAGGLVIAGYFHPKDELVADDIVVAVDAVTGKTEWKQVYKDKGLHRPVFKHPNYGPIPAAGDGKVFHLGSGALVYGLDLATGKPLWETGLGEYRTKLEKILAKNAGKPTAERSAEINKEWPWLMIAPLQVVEKTVFVTMGQWFLKEKHNPSKNEAEKAMRRTRVLFALDADSGRILWNMRNAISEGTTVCAAEVGGKTHVLAAGEDGYLRLLRPRTGEVVWQEHIGVVHRMQSLVAEGRAFVMGARDPQPGVFAPDAHLTVYALSESGAKRLWQSEYVFRQICLWTPLAYRDGIIYAGLVPTSETREGTVFAFRAEDGQILGRLSGSWLFHLWGDRLVRPGDVNHESMGGACTYTAASGDLANLALSGTPFAFRNQGPYKGVCGYEVLMIHPFVDGYLFTRAVDCEKGKGVIMCWDLRMPSEEELARLKQEREKRGQRVIEEFRAGRMDVGQAVLKLVSVECTEMAGPLLAGEMRKALHVPDAKKFGALAAAATVLGASASASLGPLINQALASGNNELALAAMRAAGLLAGAEAEKAKSVLAGFLRGTDSEMWGPASAMLRSLDPSSEERIVREMSRFGGDDGAAAVMTAIGVIGSVTEKTESVAARKAAVDAFTRFLDHTDITCQQAAMERLGALGTDAQSARKKLEELAAFPDLAQKVKEVLTKIAPAKIEIPELESADPTADL